MKYLYIQFSRSLLGVFGVILVLGTLYDLVNVQYPEYKRRNLKMDEQSVNDNTDPSSVYKLKSLNDKPEEVEKETKHEEGIICCFVPLKKIEYSYN
jgi:hypothetical protein